MCCGWLAIGCCDGVVFERGRGKTIECYTDVHHIEALLYKSMNTSVISEDRSNKATLLLTIPCSLLSRLQRIYRKQYLIEIWYGIGPKPIVAHVIEFSVIIFAI